jgi:hypothetical protein
MKIERTVKISTHEKSLQRKRKQQITDTRDERIDKKKGNGEEELKQGLTSRRN